MALRAALVVALLCVLQGAFGQCTSRPVPYLSMYIGSYGGPVESEDENLSDGDVNTVWFANNTDGDLQATFQPVGSEDGNPMLCTLKIRAGEASRAPAAFVVTGLASDTSHDIFTTSGLSWTNGETKTFTLTMTTTAWEQWRLRFTTPSMYVEIAEVYWYGTAGTCSDGQVNGDEQGVDCGGSCTACDFTCTPISTPHYAFESGIQYWSGGNSENFNDADPATVWESNPYNNYPYNNIYLILDDYYDDNAWRKACTFEIVIDQVATAPTKLVFYAGEHSDSFSKVMTVTDLVWTTAGQSKTFTLDLAEPLAFFAVGFQNLRMASTVSIRDVYLHFAQGYQAH